MSPSTDAAKYEPVMKMQSKASQLREELEVLGSNPSMRRSSMHSASPQQKRTPQRGLSVRISEPGIHHSPSQRMGSPAAPYFKPHRPYANASVNPSALRSAEEPQTRFSSSSTGSFHGVPSLDLAPPSSPPLRQSPSKRKESPPSPSGSHASHSSSKSRREMHSPQASRRSTSAKGGQLKASLAMQELNQDLTSSLHVLESTVRILKARDEETQEKLEHRQASYMRREEQLNAEIVDLKAQLARVQGEKSRDPAAEQRFGEATQSIEGLHSEVVGEIDNLLQKQALHLKHEEAASLRRFKQKLTDAEMELVELRGYCGKADAVWIERTKQLRAELESVQEIAVKLDKMYKLSEEENGRLRAQFKCQEEDREYLIRQVVNLKKDNKKLTAEIASMASAAQAANQEREDLVAAQTVASADQAAFQESSAQSAASLSPAEKDLLQVRTQRYEGIIDSLKRLVEAERRRTKQARAAHTAELTSRTELQSILRQCVEDVRMRHQAVRESGSRSTAWAPAGEVAGAASHQAPASPCSTHGNASSRSSGTGTGAGAGAGAGAAGGRPGGVRPRPFSAAPATRHTGRSSSWSVSEGRAGGFKRGSAEGDVACNVSGAVIGTSIGAHSGVPPDASAAQDFSTHGGGEGRESQGSAHSHTNPSSGLGGAGSGVGGRVEVGAQSLSSVSGRRPPVARPFSATPRMQAQRPMSGMRMDGSAVPDGAGLLANREGALSSGFLLDRGSVALGSEEREELIQILTQREDVLKVLFDRAFPGGPAPPTMPGDTERLDRLAAARDNRDATVVANARALALSSTTTTRTPMAAGGVGAGPVGTATTQSHAAAGASFGGAHAGRHAAAGAATPGSDLQREAAGRPWVFSVDAMIQDFLSNKS